MGDTMLLGVLRMPMDDPDPVQLMQFVGRARQAADRIEADAKEIERLREETKMIGISFGGTEYHGASPQQCAVCGASLPRPWVIRDYDTGRKYYFCENHYMRWDRRREAALLGVAEEFRAALAGKEPPK